MERATKRKDLEEEIQWAKNETLAVETADWLGIRDRKPKEFWKYVDNVGIGTERNNIFHR